MVGPAVRNAVLFRNMLPETVVLGVDAVVALMDVVSCGDGAYPWREIVFWHKCAGRCGGKTVGIMIS